MKPGKTLSRVIVPHSEDCFMKDSKRENKFCGMIDPQNVQYFSNAYGKPESKGHHLWLRTPCMDPKCPAIKAIHSSILLTV